MTGRASTNGVLAVSLAVMLTGGCDALRATHGDDDEARSASTATDEASHRLLLPVVARPGTARPRGYGIAGGNAAARHDRWYYSWSYGGAAHYKRERFYPMLWGGPPAPTCDPSRPEFDPNAPCTCNWITTANHQWGNQCNPGCANRPTADSPPGHEVGCTPAERIAFADRHVTFLEQDPLRRGRVWLIYNEPENLDQADLDPAEAARLYNVLVRRMRAVDPQSRFYCCGAMVDTPAKRQWMATFAQHLTEPLDGIHYHNYNTAAWHDVDATIDLMKGFFQFMQSVTSASGQRLGALPMVITEWAGLFPKAAEHRCAGANNRDGTMRAVAQWINRSGAQYGLAGAAWFIDAARYWPSCGLFEDDGAPTCLGSEYLGYSWRQVP